MKKLLILSCISIGLGACHYGHEEAEKSLKLNEIYKDSAAMREDGVPDPTKEITPTDTAAAPMDSTKMEEPKKQ